MGSDIYMYQEKKVDDEWEVIITDSNFQYYDMDIDRNYALFGYLADVRHTHPQTRPLRGVPNDMSDELREKEYDTNMHSYSWISLVEVKEAILTLTITGGTHDNSGVIYGLNEILEKMIKGLESDKDVRFIFWFDC